MIRKCFAFAYSIAALALLSQTVQTSVAADYPAKPVRMLVDSSPGGGADTLARLVAVKLGDNLKGSFVVDNRGGASGAIAIDTTAKAAADGYTVLVVAASSIMNAALINKLPYDVRTAIAPISQLNSQPYVMVVSPTIGVNSVKELIAYARSKPDAITYASAGTGSASHLGMELFRTMAGINMVHVPYKGIAPGIVDVMGGQVQVLLGSTLSVIPNMKSGRLKALAVTSAKRSQLIADLPTVAESGLPGYELIGWFGLVAPEKTPEPIIALLNAQITHIVALPDIQEKFAAGGADIAPGSPQQFREVILKDLDKWTRVIKTANLKL